jgi:hypothetical protein
VEFDCRPKQRRMSQGLAVRFVESRHRITRAPFVTP